MNCCTHISPCSSFHPISLLLRNFHILTTIYLLSPHFTSFDFTSFLITSLQYISQHFLMISTTLSFRIFLKLLALQKRVPKASTGSWFQSCMILQRNIFRYLSFAFRSIFSYIIILANYTHMH
jgi:hypothetical protein